MLGYSDLLFFTHLNKKKTYIGFNKKTKKILIDFSILKKSNLMGFWEFKSFLVFWDF